MVEDWMDIQLVESELVKETEEFVRFQFEADWKQRNKTWEIPADVQKQLDEQISETMKEREWEFPNEFVTEANQKFWYGKNRKKIVLIDGKQRGKKQGDRLGDIYY